MSRDREPSYDSDPRLPQAALLITLIVGALLGGIFLIVRGLL